MTNATQHTPLPWFYDDGQNAVMTQGMALAFINDEATAYKENAAFIVTACNSHYELLETLQEMLADQETLNSPYRNEAICEKARLAIAKATSK